MHWQTTILVPNVAAAAGIVRRGRFRLVSPDAVTLPELPLASGAAFECAIPTATSFNS